MTRKQFVEHFWDLEFLGNNGFDVLCKRLKAGRKMCKELDEYFKERIKAEQTYSKALISAVKKIQHTDDTVMGSLGRSIIQLQKETERMSSIHDEAAKQFLALERELYNFTEEQNGRRQFAEENMKRANQTKQQAYKQASTSKDKYIQRCRENDHALETYSNAKQSVTVKTKDLDKMEKIKDKAIENMEQADIVYKNNIENLENIRVIWEKEMQNTCSIFEQLEESRIEMVREVVWRSTNIDSQASVDIDQCAENIRLKLELCDIDVDIEEFINKNRTGSDRPAQILYENYYTKKGSTSDVANPGQGDRSTLSRRPMPRRPAEHVKIPPVEQQTLITFDDESDGTCAENPYASIGATEIRRERKNYKILRAYTAKGPSEHSVQSNEIVEIVREMPNSMIQINKNGRIGLVPKSCFQAIAYI